MPKTQAIVSLQKGEGTPEFELPDDISEDDEALLQGILCALYSIDICKGYKVDTATIPPHTFFLIRGQLSDETFEIEMDDLHLIKSANPLRIERIVVTRVEGRNELVIKVLNSKQRIMLTDSSMLYVTTRKRKHAKIGPSAS